MTWTKSAATAFLAFSIAVTASAQAVSFRLSMSHESFVLGETVELTLKIVNQGALPIVVRDYVAYSGNRLYLEITDQNKGEAKKIREGDIITDLALEKDEGEAIKINLSEWYHLPSAHYQVKAVLICNGLRYDSPIQVFDVVPGIELATASHYVSLRPAVERTLHLVYWGREGREIAFLRAEDKPTGTMCRTLLLGDIMRVKRPSIEKIKDGDHFYVYRQATRDMIARVEIVSDETGIRIADVKRAVESASSPMIDSLREAVEKKGKK